MTTTTTAGVDPQDADAVAEAKQLHEALREEDQVAEQVAEVRVHEDHTRETRTPGFSRMRTSWSGDDSAQVAAIRGLVDGLMYQHFADAIVIMHDLYSVVREPEYNQVTGEPLVDSMGWTIWRRSETGSYIEDYSMLGIKQREDFLFRITTKMFEWKQTQADLWGEAMFAKAIWEERFSDGFVNAAGTRPTVDDKTNQARAHATEERYFAIFKATVSRRADALVDSMSLISQRLKDILTM